MRTVDVVVPCYNYAKYLEICVRSILDQPDVAVRVLIIDDCSTDDSESVGRRLAASDSRVFYRRHEKNIGHIATYNEGLLGWVTADYCLLISADDLLVPGALPRAVDLLEDQPGVTFAYGHAVVFWGDTPNNPTPAVDGWTTVLSGAAFVQACVERLENPVPTPAAVVRTSAQRGVGGYSPQLPHSGDLEMWMRLALQGDVGIVKGPLAFYRRHVSNMTYTFRRAAVGDLGEVVKACDHALKRDADLGSSKLLTELRIGAASRFFRMSRDAGAAGSGRGAMQALTMAIALSPRSLLSLDFLKAVVSCPFLLVKHRLSSGSTDAEPGPRMDRLIGWWPGLS